MAVDVALSWDLSPTTADKVDGQRVYRSSTSSPSFPTDYTQLAEIGDSQTTFTDTGVAEDQSLTYAVTAFNSAGESDPTTDGVSTTIFNPVVTINDTDSSITTGTRARVGQAAVADTDRIVTAASRARAAATTIADTDTFATVGARTRTSQATINDTDAVTTTAARARSGQAAATDTDALAASGVRVRAAQTVIVDTDSLTAVGTLFVASRLFSTITDTDSLTAAGTRTRGGEATTTDTDAVTASGTRVRSGQATILDADTLAAGGTRTRAGQATIVDADTLAASGTRTRRGVAQVVDTDALTATSTRPRFGVATITDTDALTATGTAFIFQNEIRWLLDTLITAWPGDGPPDNVAFRNRDEPITYYHPDNGTDPDALGDYDAVREQAAPLDGFRTISVASDTVGREFRGNKPQYDVTTTLDIWVQDKTSYEHGAADDVADHDTLVAMLKRAINTQIVYPQVVPNADPAGRVDYFDLGITTTEYRSVEFKDQYRTDFTVRLRGRQDTP